MTAYGPPPPIDPQRDARRQARATRHRRRDVLGMVCVMLQPMLALGFGGWAASPLAPEWEEALPYASVAMVFALAAAWGLTLGLRYALGTLVAVASLPRMVKRVTASPPPTPRPGTARDDRSERGVDIASVLLHALVFIAGALLIAAVAAGASTLFDFSDLAWRFALPAAALCVLTKPALRVMWSGEG